MPAVPWKDDFYLDCYLLALQGLRDSQIAESLGVGTATFKGWCGKRPALRRALTLARDTGSGRGAARSFRSYVYERLPPDLKDLWDRIRACEDLPNGTLRAEALLANRGEGVRMHLFLHAWVHYNFNASEACRVLGISKAQLDRWKKDPDFQRLLDEIQWHKANLFEDHLIRGVKGGDSSLIRFANATFNKGRGYQEEKHVKKEEESRHLHVHAVTTAKLLPLLDLETKKKLLAAIETLEAGAAASPAPLALPGPAAR